MIRVYAIFVFHSSFSHFADEEGKNEEGIDLFKAVFPAKEGRHVSLFTKNKSKIKMPRELRKRARNLSIRKRHLRITSKEYITALDRRRKQLFPLLSQKCEKRNLLLSRNFLDASILCFLSYLSIVTIDSEACRLDKKNRYLQPKSVL